MPTFEAPDGTLIRADKGLRLSRQAFERGVENIYIKGEKPPAGWTVRPGITLAQRIIRGAALPTALGAVGAGAGAAAGAFTGGAASAPLALAGLVAGSATGEAINQFFDPLDARGQNESTAQIVFAGAAAFAPAAARKAFLSFAPGVAPGLQSFLISRLGPKGEKVISRLVRPEGLRFTTSQLFQRAERLAKGVRIPFTKTSGLTVQLGREVERSQFAGAASKALIRRMNALIEGGADFQKFRLNMIDLGAKVGAMTRTGGPALGRAKALYGAMWDDLNTALAKAGNTEADKALRLAIESFKREQAASMIGDFFKRTGGFGGAGLRQINVNRLLQRIDDMRDVLGKMMPKADVDDLFNTVREFRDIPTIPTTSQLGIEGGINIPSRIIVGAVAGQIIGGGEGALAGVIGVEVLARMLATAPGRTAVRGIAASGSMNLSMIANALAQSATQAIKRPEVSVPTRRGISRAVEAGRSIPGIGGLLEP